MAGPQPLELLPDCFSRQNVNAVIDYEDNKSLSLEKMFNEAIALTKGSFVYQALTTTLTGLRDGMAKAKTESGRMGQTPTDQRQTSFSELMEQLSDFAIFASKLQLITTTLVDSMANRNAERSLAEDDWKHLRLCLTTELDRGRKLLRLAIQIDANLAALEEIACEDVDRSGKYRLHIRLREDERSFLLSLDTMEYERSDLAKQLEHPQIHQRLKAFFKGQPLRKQLGQLCTELYSEQLMDLKKAVNKCSTEFDSKVLRASNARDAIENIRATLKIFVEQMEKINGILEKTEEYHKDRRVFANMLSVMETVKNIGREDK